MPNGSAGDRPGEFDSAAAIATDPNHVLYVASTAIHGFNASTAMELLVVKRVQPVNSWQWLFVFGHSVAPNNIAVNSSSFYVIDGQRREIVHVFDAAVIHGIDDTSAWVEYQSDSNFRGSGYRFTFLASDGFELRMATCSPASRPRSK